MNRYRNSPLRYYLFARPNFLGGAAYIMDLGNTLFMFNDSPTPEAADYMALKNDWVLVGQDVQEAIDNYAAPEEQLELLPSNVG